MKHSLKLLVSPRGISTLGLHTFAAFGLLSGLVQLTSSFWSLQDRLPHRVWFFVGVIFLSVAWGIMKAFPHSSIEQGFSRPDMRVSVVVGDIFDQACHLVVGFSDTFDTDITDSVIINAKSIQGQFLRRIYGGDIPRLDGELSRALAGVEIVDEEPSGAKRGKLKRYPIGTVAALGAPERRCFAVAYSRMGNDLIARSNVDQIWHSLNQVWDAMYIHGQRGRLAIPLVGSEFARISCLDRESLLKMILISFVARSRQDPVCQELKVVIHPRDYEKINMLEVRAFLQSL